MAAYADEPWWVKAACREADPEVFVRTRARSRYPSGWAQARELCDSCPVRNACLTDALKHPPVYDGQIAEYDMFQGGCTPQELTTLSRRARR